MTSPCLATEAAWEELERTREDPRWGWQPKLDGTRCLLHGTVGIARSGKPLRLPPGVYGPPDQLLDGELLDSGWFVAFDLPGHPGSYTERLAALAAVCTHAVGDHVRMIKTAQTPDEKRALEALAEAQDLEGFVLKRMAASHQPGRSRDWIKVKRWKTCRVRVTARDTSKHIVSVEATDLGLPYTVGGDVNVSTLTPLPEVGTHGEVRYIYVTTQHRLYHATWLRAAQA